MSTKYLSEFIRHESLHYCRMLLIFALMNSLQMWVSLMSVSLTDFSTRLERFIKL